MRLIYRHCLIVNIVNLNSFFLKTVINLHIFHANTDFVHWLKLSDFYDLTMKILMIFNSVQPSLVNCVINQVVINSIEILSLITSMSIYLKRTAPRIKHHLHEYIALRWQQYRGMHLLAHYMVRQFKFMKLDRHSLLRLKLAHVNFDESDLMLNGINYIQSILIHKHRLCPSCVSSAVYVEIAAVGFAKVDLHDAEGGKPGFFFCFF